jgi:Domain of unknown function (DUF1918)
VTDIPQRPAGAKAGDLVVISGHRVGEAERVGEILEVVIQDSSEHYRVRWDDEHESWFYPSSDATIRPATRRGKEAKRDDRA